MDLFATHYRHAGEIRAGLAAQGTPIGAYDVLVAGQARARGLVLVTRNLREFERVPGLSVEYWQDLECTSELDKTQAGFGRKR